MSNVTALECFRLAGKVAAITPGPRPGPLGGDRRSGRIEAHAPAILAFVDAKPDITLVEIKAGLV